MIPPILHQTWKTDEIPPRFRAWSESWAKHNPGWTRMFWNDRALIDFVGTHYPDFLATFCGYQQGILRADAARYMLLHHFGGVYADLDCECVASFAPLMSEDRIVFCKEPFRHFAEQASFRGLPYLLFNGTIVSPPKHPFWLHLLSYLPDLADAKEVIDATGPCVLTSAQLSFADRSSFALHPSALFTPLDRDGAAGESGEPQACKTLSVHHWVGTWWKPAPRENWRKALKRHLYKAKYLATRGEQLDLAEARAAIDPAALARPAPKPGGNIAVLVPLRDAAEHVEPFLAAVRQLDHPPERIKLVFCEGDSRDGSWDVLRKAVEPLGGEYRRIVLLQKHLGTELDRARRALPKLQRERRCGLAKVRNHLIRNGLDEEDDWALWIDIDVWKFPDDIVRTLTAAGHRIVVPNCVLKAGGRSLDFNSFVTTRPQRDHRYFRSTVRGVYQPPSDFIGRRHLSDVRHLEKIALDGVGGSMLLVDAALHRGGLLFPEKPYRDLVETEGFGVLAKDVGVRAVGLPRVEIFHVPW
ncbi:MAG: glycosyl transferase [Rhizobiales bacterium 65-79]|jgi:hypothetical protein|nr:glycosyl transferase [Hyphomicrobiales bacterium]OJU01447.1 MAG: glycosyl transferase [Rhizobiales bacterium 65-79]